MSQRNDRALEASGNASGQGPTPGRVASSDLTARTGNVGTADRTDRTGAAGTGHLEVVTATGSEGLLDALVHRLRATAPADPFVPITIMVQSRGMERWLTHQLAQRLDPDGGGITANVAFPFPGAVIDRLATACLADTPEQDPWQPDRLVWPVLSLLAEHRGHPGLARLAPALGDLDTIEDAEVAVGRRSWQLAWTIADVLQSYALARPTMTAAWLEGNDVGPDGRALDARDTWQPWLWRALVARVGDDPGRRLRAVTAALDDPQARIDLPADLQQLRSFGISVLPEVHLALLAALARRTRVELYVPTPSPRRWTSISGALDRGAPRPEPTNPLLGSCGRVSDDAVELFHRSRAHHQGVEAPATGAPPSAAAHNPTLLGVLQDSLREDTLPAAPDRLPLVAGDTSVRVHRCFGPARQAEVLRDVVLGLLADDPTLEPRDVLVMTPDITMFGPLVQAAFVGHGAVPDVPVRIADRPLGAANPAADALLAVLELATGRTTATQLLDVLGRAPIARRFGLTPAMLERFASWAADTGIAWGRDEVHREQHGQPADRIHSWRFGLDRLLLGVAMVDDGERIVGDVTPYDHVEGDDVVAAGRLAQACHILFDTAASMTAPRHLRDWHAALVQAMGRCLDVEAEDTWRLQELRTQLDTLRDVAPDGDTLDGDTLNDVTLQLDAIRAVLAQTLTQRRSTAGYETGAVTVCELVPMRSIPHRVVCLLGMDDGSFPRAQRRPGFDLLERHDAVGDRSRRTEDRALFLEAVLAARQHLVVMTTGWDVQTGEERPPAVPLAELLDLLELLAVGEPEVRDVVTVDHPVHPYAPAAFDGSRGGGPTSFDAQACAAAAQLRSPDRQVQPLLTAPLPPQHDDGDTPLITTVALPALIGALTHPTRHLLTARLKVDLREYLTEVVDLEPVTLDGRTKARLGGGLLREDTAQGRIDALLASGTVPAGTPGRHALQALNEEVAKVRDTVTILAAEVGLADDLDPLRDGARRTLDIPIAQHRLVGDIDGLFALPGAPARTLWLLARFHRPRPTHRLEVWVTHLALTAAGVAAPVSVLVTRGGPGSTTPSAWRVEPLAEDPDEAARLAEHHLGQLLAVYDDAQRQPLPLFANASSSYAERSSRTKAREAFLPGFVSDGDLDAEVTAMYGADADLDDILTDEDGWKRFALLADVVWGPALAHTVSMNKRAGGAR